VRTRFDERHAQIHGHAARERSVELVSYRLRVRVTVPKYQPVPEALPASPRGIETAIKGRRRIHLAQRDSAHAILYERDQLEIGAAVTGPAIIEQFDSTTVIPPGWSGCVDAFRNLILRRE
jgi:N-methylhydantoinase A/oxoprolinase/acetone carboxylase beta subunit